MLMQEVMKMIIDQIIIITIKQEYLENQGKSGSDPESISEVQIQ